MLRTRQTSDQFVGINVLLYWEVKPESSMVVFLNFRWWLQHTVELLLYSFTQRHIIKNDPALTGIISSYVSQGFTALQSMFVATNLFGFAGEQLERESYSFTARNLIKCYSKYIAKIG